MLALEQGIGRLRYERLVHGIGAGLEAPPLLGRRLPFHRLILPLHDEQLIGLR